MITTWRVTKTKHAPHALDGEGPRLYGGRWTSKGNRVVYASQSLSLAVLEVLVHLQSMAPLHAYCFHEISFDPGVIREVPREGLPDGWRTYPAPPELQRMGDEWIQQSSSAVLRVPSAVLPQEHNYLINPAHADFDRVSVEGPWELDPDPRLFGR